MSHSLTPQKILSDFRNGELTNKMATELLVSLIERSEDDNERADGIKILGEFNYINEHTFKVLENSLLSDECPIVRTAASEVIIKSYLESGIKAIKWSLRHEKSPLVLKSIFDLLGTVETSSHHLLKNDLSNWISNFASKIGIVPEEGKFFLDVEALFAKIMKNYEIGFPTYKYYKNLTRFSKTESWLVIKNYHVEILSFNWQNWKILKESQNLFKSISRLSYPSFYLNTLKKYNLIEVESLEIPSSISLLSHLKKLNLSRNQITEIPSSISSLPSLEELDLNRNNIHEIPESLSFLQSLKALNLTRNHIQTIPLSLHKFLNSLEEFNY